MQMLIMFLIGCTFALAATIGLYFAHFRARTGDRLFLMFALAFWLLAVGWMAQAGVMVWETLHPPAETGELAADLSTPEANEMSVLVYIPRLLAFVCIIWGIIEKNRSSGTGRDEPSAAGAEVPE